MSTGAVNVGVGMTCLHSSRLCNSHGPRGVSRVESRFFTSSNNTVNGTINLIAQYSKWDDKKTTPNGKDDTR